MSKTIDPQNNEHAQQNGNKPGELNAKCKDLLDNRETKLNGFIEKNSGQYSYYIAGSILFAVIGIVFAVAVYSKFNLSFWCFCHRPMSVIWPVIACLVIVAILFGIAAMFVSSYTKNSKSIEHYQNELIVVHDLKLALTLACNASDADFDKTTITSGDGTDKRTTVKHKSQRSKLEEQIVATLLDRCAK